MFSLYLFRDAFAYVFLFGFVLEPLWLSRLFICFMLKMFFWITKIGGFLFAS